MRRLLGVATLVALVSACGGGGGGGEGPAPPAAGPALTASFLPLADGHRWTYRDGDGHLGGQAVVARSDTSEGTRWRLQALADGELRDIHVLAGPAALRLLPDPADPLAAAIGAYDILRFPMRAGDRFVQVEKSFDLDINADGRSDRVRVRSVLELVAFETLDTDVGRFAETAHLRTTIETRVDPAGGPAVDGLTVVDEWYAAGIGLLRQDRSDSVGGAAPTPHRQRLLGYRSAAGRSDEVPPTVLSMAPGSGRTRPPASALRLAFDELMDPLAMRLARLELRRVADGQPVAGTTTAGETSLSMGGFADLVLAPGEYEARVVGALFDAAGHAVAPAPWRFTIDPMAAEYSDASPADGAVDVALDTVLRFTLDEVPDLASLRQNLSLVDQEGAVPFDLSLEDRTVVLRPQRLLGRDRWHTLRLDTLLVDRDGNRLDNGFVLSFVADAGMFRAAQALPSQPIVLRFVAGDVDGDGRAEVVELGHGPLSEGVGLYLIRRGADGQSRSEFMHRHDVEVDGVSCTAQALLLHDRDGDGRAELIRSGCNAVEILARETSGLWVRTGLVRVGAPTQIRVADLDGDGRPDLAIGRPGEVTLWTLPPAGDPAPLGRVDFAGLDAVDVAIGDLNADGRPDVAVSTAGAAVSGGGVHWRLRSADGSYGGLQSHAAHHDWGARALAIGDLDGDGRADLVASTGGNSPTYLALYRQQPDGTLAAMERLPTYDIPDSLLLRDLDGDGRLDIVVSHPSWARLGVYRQGADGHLAEELLFTIPGYAGGLAAGDLDGDGLPDLVVERTVLLQKR